jgi:DNA primase
MLSSSTIDAIHDLPIEQIISQFVELKKAGVNYKCPCPFHNEKSASFVVSNQKNIYKCFGCGRGGDGIQFVMEHEKIPFIEACKLIASKHGIFIEETEVKGKTPEQKQEEDLMLALMQEAQLRYRSLLIRESLEDLTWSVRRQWAEVRRYLIYTRRLALSTIIEWQLGWCNDWKVFTPDIMNKGGYNIGEKAGLVRTGNGVVYDFFHHRITVPIRNAQGQVVGLGGRIMPGMDGAKYLNPSESAIYPKSKVLFGLEKARKNFKTWGCANLVEGYFDAIKLHQFGWNHTIASCGTALTDDQAKLLKRYTDTISIMRDGDNAGRKAIEKDILVLVPHQFKIYLYLLPDGEDPDSMVDRYPHYMTHTMPRIDAIEWLCALWLNQGFATDSPAGRAEAIGKVVGLLSEITSNVYRDQYMQSIVATWKGKLKTADLAKPLDKVFQQRKADAEAAARAKEDEDEFSLIPAWVDRKSLEENGFVQLVESTKGYKSGIYFLGGSSIEPVTNFTINPLYHIFEQSNNRRLIEVNNCIRSAVVEMPTAGFVNQATFETELMNKGNFVTKDNFTKKHFKRIVGWLSNTMPIAYELKTLGWQPEGFFAYSNAVFDPETQQILEYDEMGMIRIADKFYMSLGNSKIHRDERITDNPYENDLYLKYVKSNNITFADWARQFAIAYGENAPYAISFCFLTIFKDIVTRIAKMPMLSCTGPKGSGKSELAESVTRFFFSGKNGEGDLIKGFNLNPGQSTPFSFYNRVERFRNCPILFNEFDENEIEPWKFGTFKASYDGEAREVGEGSTGKARKTKIQKVQGTIILVGQYLSIKDDGSVLSRSISCLFGLERIKNLDQSEINAHKQLKDWEHEGLSGLLIELLMHRDQVKKLLPTAFVSIQSRLMKETKDEGHRIEARLISNYSLILAGTSVMLGIGTVLPYDFETFFKRCKDQIIAHNKMLKDNSAIQQFWKSIEFLFDSHVVVENRDLKVRSESHVTVKEGSSTKEIKFNSPKNVLYVRFGNLYAIYAKYARERTGKPAIAEDTLLLYMKEQPFYIGLAPMTSWEDKRTSSFAFDYDQMQELGFVFEKNNHSTNTDQSGHVF